MMHEQRLLAVSPNLPCAMDRHEWSLEDYHICRTLYNGYAAQVYTATCRYSGMEVVLKIYHDVDKAPDVAQHEMYREVAIQSGLQHPNVVHLFGAFEEGDTLVLVQEYVPNGDLLGLMHSHGGRVDEATVVKAVLRPLLGSLMYLHRWGIVHRDVKPENVLFAADGTIKLADFGLAINMVEERPISRVGTLDYMAPEVLRCPIKQSMAMTPAPGAPARYGFATDVWAVGIVTYELLTGLPPYASDCRYQAESRICSALPPLFPNSVSPLARDFILRALAPIPGDRPTVRQLMEHPWIVNPDGCVAPSRPLPHPFPAAQAQSPSQPQPQPQRAAQTVAQMPPAPTTSSSPAHQQQHHTFPGGYSSDPQQHASTSCAAASAAVQPLQATLSAPLSAASVMVASPTAAAAAAAAKHQHMQHKSPRVQPHQQLQPSAGAAEAVATPAAALSIDQQLRALQQQQLLDLSKLPLDQIQGMIQKLQEAMQLAVVQQHQQQQAQHPALSATATAVNNADTAGTLSLAPALVIPAVAGAVVHSSCAAGTASAPLAGSSSSLGALRCPPADGSIVAAAAATTATGTGHAAGDDFHMADLQSEGAYAVAGCVSTAAAAGAASDEALPAAHSCSSSPQAAAAAVCDLLRAVAQAAATAHLSGAVCASQAAFPTADTASYASTATGYGSLCASRRSTAEVTPRTVAMATDSPTRVSFVRQVHSPLATVPLPPSQPPQPRATEGGASPACTITSPVQPVMSTPRLTCSGGDVHGAGLHGGALHEGDGLVYVSIGSSRKAAEVGSVPCQQQQQIPFVQSPGAEAAVAAWMRQFAAP